jgi:hypothetical protein
MKIVLNAFTLISLLLMFTTSAPTQPQTPSKKAACGQRGEYCVNRATSNGWCKVQEATEAQMYGPTLVGGFKSQKDATTEMCKRYDFGSTDPNKCSDALPKGTCGSRTSKDDTGTVSLVGRNIDSSDTKTFGLLLVLADNTWQEFEPGYDTHFFKSKKGIYIYVGTSNTVYICRENTVGDCAAKPDSQAGQLIMTGGPSSAKKGDTGNGHAEESGIEFSWVVQ